MIDYAYPTMMAEKALKQMHDAMLMKRYDEALQMTKDAMNYLFDVQIAVLHEKNKEEARNR